MKLILSKETVVKWDVVFDGVRAPVPTTDFVIIEAEDIPRDMDIRDFVSMSRYRGADDILEEMSVTAD